MESHMGLQTPWATTKKKEKEEEKKEKKKEEEEEKEEGEEEEKSSRRSDLGLIPKPSKREVKRSREESDSCL